MQLYEDRVAANKTRFQKLKGLVLRRSFVAIVEVKSRICWHTIFWKNPRDQFIHLFIHITKY